MTNTADNADSASALLKDDGAAPSGDEDQQELEVEGEEEEIQTADDEAELGPDVTPTQETQKRFDKFASTITSQQETIDEQAAAIEQLQQGGRFVTSSDEDEPKPDDYEDDAEYSAAKGAWLGERKAIERFNLSQQQDVADQNAYTANRKVDAYVAKIPEIEKTIPDFKKVVDASLLISKDAQGYLTPATEAILEVENGPLVAVHIAKNPLIAKALNRASPTIAAITIARLSYELSANPAPIPKRPDPIDSVDTGAGTAPAGDGLKHIKGLKLE